MRQQKHKKEEKDKPLQTNEDKILPAEKGYFIHETFYADLTVTTEDKGRAET